MNKNITIALLGFLGLVGLASGQQTTTTATLNAAMSRGDQSISLSASTGVQAASTSPVTGVFVDREYMTITTNVGGNVWGVKRGVNGVQSPHASGATVFIGVPGTFDLGPRSRVGTCTAASFPTLPIINVLTGDLQTCGSNGQWVTWAYASRASVGAQITAAATITITNPVHHVTGATAINTITATNVPAGGCITLIPDSAGSTGTSGNIALASTLVQSKALTLCYDPALTKWYPSY